MSALTIYVEGAGVWSPQLVDFGALRAALQGEAPAPPSPRPAATVLPAGERRRAPESVLLAVEVAAQAVAMSGREAATLPCVFTSSHGDQAIMDYMCTVLASAPSELSPTRFHNSVHNAPAGYWSIATHAMAPSNVLCAYDGSFAAGLLDSLCQVAIDATPTLLIAYDGDYPEPLNAVRPVPDTFAVALVLAPEAGPRTLARIDVALTDAASTALAQPELEALWHGNAAARALPLLEALAARRAANVVLDYLPDTRVRVDITFGTP